MLQNHASIAKIGAQTEQVVAFAADQAHPERHDLHVTSGTRARNGVLPKTALDLDQGKHELGIEPRAGRFEMQ